MGDRIFSEEISDQLEKIFFYDILEKKRTRKAIRTWSTISRHATNHPFDFWNIRIGGLVSILLSYSVTREGMISKISSSSTEPTYIK